MKNQNQQDKTNKHEINKHHQVKNQQDMINEEHEINKQQEDMTNKLSGCEEKDKHLLALSLSFLAENNQPPPSPLQALLSQPPPPHIPLQQPTLPSPPPPTLLARPPPVPPTSMVVPGPSPRLRVRRNLTQAAAGEDLVPAPFPWATTRRATVHSLNYLLSNQISVIKGQVQCKKCEQKYEIDYHLGEKFHQVGTFIAENKGTMHERAPTVWMNPIFPSCKICTQENAVKPVIAEKKKSINWLFLLLGQLLGCCTLEQLKYFCKHTKHHRTGAKDRVLYLTYLGLCKQLDPNGPFDR